MKAENQIDSSSSRDSLEKLNQKTFAKCHMSGKNFKGIFTRFTSSKTLKA